VKKTTFLCDTNTHTWRDKEFHVLARYFPLFLPVVMNYQRFFCGQKWLSCPQK
jgi:hypothetical protein